MRQQVLQRKYKKKFPFENLSPNLFIPFGPNNEAYFSVVTIASLFSFVKRKYRRYFSFVCSNDLVSINTSKSVLEGGLLKICWLVALTDKIIIVPKNASMFTAKISRVFQSREIFCSCRWKKGQWDDNKDCDINRNKEIEKKTLTKWC